MNYNEALKYLRDLTKFGFNFGLDRIQRLLELLDAPHKKIKTVHVAGTNGKGSVCAYTSNILSMAGYKTGLFTSPHLHSYTERIKINGQEISQEDVARYITELRPLILQMVSEGYEHPTEFEVNTALAFKYFADQQVDIAVIEVGMGGAIDSTNVIEPLVSAITNVSLDHLDYLGTTIEKIAQVKAGIIKKGTPCVTAAEGSALEVISRRCKELLAPLTVIGEDFQLLKSAQFPPIKTQLLGEHQNFNVGVALGIISALRENGFEISDQALIKGFAQTKWPARLEVISQEPLLIIDAAHNHAGARVLAAALKKLLPQKAVFVLGILADKERQKIIDELMPFIERVVITKPNTPRAGSWQEIYEVFIREGISAEIEESINLAVEKAISYGLPIVLTGSIYMIAEARAYLLGIPQE